MYTSITIDPKYKNLLLEIIEKHIPNCSVILFGSRAKKTHAPHSDIDIALDTNTIIDSTLLGTIKDEIEESTVPFFVDVVDIHNISKELKEQIEKHGIIWKK